MRKKFAVIISHYNQLETLPILFEALNRQSFRDFDVHICDDGSSVDIESFMAARNSELTFDWYLHTQKNKGNFGANINQGVRDVLRNHPADYCVFIASDSFPDSDYLEQLAEYAEPWRFVCGIRIHIDKGAAVDVECRLKKEMVPEDRASIMAAHPWSLLTGNGLTVPTQAFRELGLWDEDFKSYGGEDQVLIAKLYFNGYIAWSVPYLRLFHHWHKTKEESKENAQMRVDKIKLYAA